MRRIFALVTLVALAACGGGGGHGTSALPSSPGGGAAPTYTGATEKPTFTIRIPPRTTSAKYKRKPQTVSPSTLSVVITLTGDSIGVDPTTIPGYAAETDIGVATCSSGCTVSGPPSPIGNDTFSIITYDTAGGTGNALDSSFPTLAIAQGVNNSESITLDGIVAEIFLNQPPTPTADQTASSVLGSFDATNATVLVVATDAQDNIISGNYANPITLTEADTVANGQTITSGSCSFPGNNTGLSTTTAVLASSSATATLCYGGEAENAATLTASASGVTYDPFNNIATVEPALNAVVETSGSATPAGVASDSGEIDLYTTSGLGSTGSITYTEAGWTDAPYNQELLATYSGGGDCSSGGPFTTYATVSSAVASGTQFTVTAVGSPAAGDCPLTVGDGLTNSSDQPASLATTYTTTGFGVNSVHRRPPAVVKIKH